LIFDDVPVSRRSQQDIEASARPWSDVGAPNGGLVIDMIRLYKEAKVELIARPDAEMGTDLAHAVPQLNRVFIRESLLRAAKAGDLEAKMVLAHEFGHVVLHRGAESKARKVEGNAPLRFIPEEESAEAQAWKFARALTMPLSVVDKVQTADELATYCQVSVEHARLRLTERRQLFGKRASPSFVQGLLPRKSPSELAEERKAKEARERLQIWNKAQRIPGDRTNSRMCSRGKWRVVWSEYNQMTECGWIIREGAIIAWMDLRS
jgi:hypothetical protein